MTKKTSKGGFGNYAKKAGINLMVIFAVTGLLGGGKLMKALWATNATNYMENKFHKEFVYKGYMHSPHYGIVIVSPKDEPTRNIEVDVYGKMPWDMAYVDHYSTDIAEEYLKNYLNKTVKSKYASNVFIQSENPLYVNEEGQKVDSMYTLEQIGKGQKFAPEAYTHAQILIHMYGKEDVMEELIKEQWMLMHALKNDGFAVAEIGIRLMVAPEHKLEEHPEYVQIYEKSSAYSIGSAMNDEVIAGNVWRFDSGEKKSDEKALLDFEYFKSAFREYLIKARS